MTPPPTFLKASAESLALEAAIAARKAAEAAWSAARDARDAVTRELERAQADVRRTQAAEAEAGHALLRALGSRLLPA